MIFMLTLLSGLLLSAEPETPPANSAVPEATQAAIEQLAKAYAEAWNKGDATAVANLYTDSGDYISNYTVRGIVLGSRSEIEGALANTFKKQKLTLTLETESFQPVWPDRVLRVGKWKVTGATEDFPKTEGTYFEVYEQVEGAWKIVYSISMCPLITPMGAEETG